MIEIIIFINSLFKYLYTLIIWYIKQSMKILITGVAGLIGSSLANYYIKKIIMFMELIT